MDGSLYLTRGYRLEYANKVVYKSLKIVFYLSKQSTVCQRTRLGVSSVERVERVHEVQSWSTHCIVTEDETHWIWVTISSEIQIK